jgi:hypothetical protein
MTSGYTITPTENGDFNIQHTASRGGQTVAWTPNDVTGEPEYWEADRWSEVTDDADYDRYADEEPNINAPAGIAALDPNASAAAAAQYWLSGRASDAEIQQIVNSIDDSDPTAVDRISHLLAFKNGELSLADLQRLEPAVYEELAPFINGTSSSELYEDAEPVDALIDEVLSDDAKRQLENADPAEIADLRDTASDLLGAEPEPQYAEASAQKAEEAYAAGDGEAALIWQLNANFNAGTMTAKECLTVAIQKLGTTRAYNKYLEITQGDPEALAFGYENNDTDYDY